MSLLLGGRDTADDDLCKLLRAIRGVDSRAEDRSTSRLFAGPLASVRKPPTIPHPGRVIRGTWVLSERLGQGGFGLVFSAYHRALNRVDALKFLHPHLAHDPELRMRFAREAMVMARLRGDHLVQVYDCGEHDGLPFFAMEHLRGRSLQEIATSRQPMSLARFHGLARGILRGLAEIHTHGIVHRDIKPANIFVLEQEQRVKMLDFGLAKTSMRLTSRQAIMGTLRYMAPELLLSPDTEASVTTDVYSAGVVLYQLLTGRVPYDVARDANISDFLQCAVSGVPRSPRSLRPSMPVCLEELILQAIDKKPSHRPQSARAFAEALDQAMAEGASSPARMRRRGSEQARVAHAPCSMRPYVAIPAWNNGNGDQAKKRARRERIAYVTTMGMGFKGPQVAPRATALGPRAPRSRAGAGTAPQDIRRGHGRLRFLALAIIMLSFCGFVPITAEPRTMELLMQSSDAARHRRCHDDLGRVLRGGRHEMDVHDLGADLELEILHGACEGS